MKKIILTIVFAVIAIVSMAQYRPVFVVADTGTVFGKSLSERTLIYCDSDSTIYATTAYVSSSMNINTAPVRVVASVGGSYANYWQRSGDTTQILNATDNLQVGSGFYYKGGSDYALSIGRDNNINGYGYSIYVGREIYGTGESQLIVGHWNDSLKTGNAFSVGTGIAGARFNAFDVMRDSTTHINGRIVNKVSDTVVNIDTNGITINKIPTSVVMIVGELDSVNITQNPQIDTTVSVGTYIELIGNDDTKVVRFENGDGLVIGGTGYIRLGNNDVATFRRIKGKGWILTSYQDN